MKFFALAALAAPMLSIASPGSSQEAAPLPRFEAIELNGGGSVRIRYAPVQRVTIRSGSSRFTDIRVTGRGEGRNGDEGRLVIDACNRDCPRRYDLQIDIETPDVQAVAIRGGGDIRIEAGFPRQDSVAAAVSGGGEIDLRALPVRNVAASVNGGGGLLVRPGENLAASIRGGGEIRYWGDPQIATSVEGGGLVRKGG